MQIRNRLIDKIRLLFRSERESYLCFYRILGFYPRDLRIYRQALLHKSTAARSDKGRPLNNERLEFLGDAILNAVVGDIVYRHFDGQREGFLTNARSRVVQRDTLNKLAVKIGLDKLVKSNAHTLSHNSYVYGNAFEAFVGAIYLDRGYEHCYWFIEKRIFGKYIDLDKISRKEKNFKSKLIEWSQKNKVEVSFELIEQMLDKDYNPTFHTEVRIMGIRAGKGFGYSKKESQQNAAQTALNRIRGDVGLKKAIEQAKAERDKAKIPSDVTKTTEGDEPLGSIPMTPSMPSHEPATETEATVPQSLASQEPTMTPQPAEVGQPPLAQQEPTAVPRQGQVVQQ